MKVSRNDLIELLFRKRHNGLVKIITGIRRCGKSYLLSEDGIITVGAIPFLLDKTILNMALAGE